LCESAQKVYRPKWSIPNMKNSKLILILKTFSKKDWKAFSKWSRSCYEPDSTGEMMIRIISKEVNLS